jgi:hypothetical protein
MAVGLVVAFLFCAGVCALNRGAGDMCSSPESKYERSADDSQVEPADGKSLGPEEQAEAFSGGAGGTVGGGGANVARVAGGGASGENKTDISGKPKDNPAFSQFAESGEPSRAGAGGCEDNSASPRFLSFKQIMLLRRSSGGGGGSSSPRRKQKTARVLNVDVDVDSDKDQIGFAETESQLQGQVFSEKAEV